MLMQSNGSFLVSQCAPSAAVKPGAMAQGGAREPAGRIGKARLPACLAPKGAAALEAIFGRDRSDPRDRPLARKVRLIRDRAVAAPACRGDVALASPDPS